ncbi:hypothetical protein RCL1_005373 [Eukaryota sp. TZLM3-RCL]
MYLYLVVLLSLALAQWDGVPAAGFPPSARQLVMFTQHDDTVYYLGGATANDQPLDDLWSFNMVTERWNYLLSRGSTPASHSGCLWYSQSRNQLVQYSGVRNRVDSDSIFTYNFESATWSEHLVVSGPSTRRRSACTTVTLNGKDYGLMFGGSNTEFLNDFWLLDFDTLTFTQATLDGSSEAPSPRQLANLVPFNSDLSSVSLILYSGRTHMQSNEPDKHDTFVIKISNDFTIEVTEITNLVDGSPIPVYLSPAFWDSTLKRVVIAGGWIRHEGVPSGFIQILDTNNKDSDYENWQWIKTLMTSSTDLDVRMDSAGASYYNSVLYLFSGYYWEGVFNTMIKCDFNVWDEGEQFEVVVFSPNMRVAAPMNRHKAVTIGNIMYIIGGNRPSTPSYSENFIWIFNLETHLWGTHEVVSAFAPKGLINHCVVAFGRRIYVFYGQFIESGELNQQVFEFDTVTSRWRAIETTGDVPLPRTLAGCAMKDHYVFTFGGQTARFFSNELFYFNILTSQWKSVESTNDMPSLDSVGLVAVNNDYLALTGGRPSSLGSRFNMIFKAKFDDIFSNEPVTWKTQTINLEGPEVAPMVNYDMYVFGNVLFFLTGDSWGSFMNSNAYTMVPSFDSDAALYVKFYNRLSSDDVPELLYYSSVAYKNSFYIYGGSATTSNVELIGSAFPFMFKHTVDFSELEQTGINCFVGAQLNDDVCTSCSSGYYGQVDSSSSLCNPCPAGFYHEQSNLIGKESCLPCPFGSYQDEQGQGACKPCPEGKYCPLGSIAPLDSIEFNPNGISIQPDLIDNNKQNLKFWSSLVFIVSGVVLVAVIVLSFILSSSNLFKSLDFYSKVSNLEPSSLGGSFSLTALVVSLGVCSLLTVFLVFDNTLTTVSQKPSFLIEDLPKFSGSIASVIHDFTGDCSNLQFEVQINDATCQSTVDLIEPMGNHCRVNIELNNCILSSSSFITIISKEINSHTHLIETTVSSTSPNGASSFKQVVSANDGFLLKGNVPTVFDFSVVPSIVDGSKVSSTGHLTNFNQFDLGDYQCQNGYSYTSGLSFGVKLSLSSSVYLIDVISRVHVLFYVVLYLATCTALYVVSRVLYGIFAPKEVFVSQSNVNPLFSGKGPVNL